MNFLSVCSGIEAASVAWGPLGWKAVAFSEIEPFPCHALHHHYGAGRPHHMPSPDADGLKPEQIKARQAAICAVSKLPLIRHGATPANWGDMSKFQEWPDVSIDLLCGGTPCQSFSVAGLRDGLADPRGNLMLTFGAIAAKYRPQWLVWENVPGVLSSEGGTDFASFLGLITGQVVEVPAGGWSNSGVVAGIDDAYGVAYRVLDAQYFGVPQRRRRVFVVGYLGDWRPAAAVLLERQSLQRNPAPSRKARQGSTAGTLRSTQGGGDVDHGRAGHLIAGTLAANGKAAGSATQQDAEAGMLIPQAFGGNNTAGPIDVAAAVRAHGSPHYDFESETFIAQTLTGGARSAGGYSLDDLQMVAHSLRGEGFDASEDGTGRGTPLAAVAIDLRNGILTEDGPTQTIQAAGLGTERGGNPNAMPHVLAYRTAGDGAVFEEGSVTAPLTTGTDQCSNILAFDTTQVTSATNRSNPQAVDPCHPLAAGMHAPAIAFDGRMRGAEPAVGRQERPPQSMVERTGAIDSTKPWNVAASMQVRRLTPRECERLQGFPDDYTLIPSLNLTVLKGVAASKLDRDFIKYLMRGGQLTFEQCIGAAADGPRYKALGNSWAIPNVRWIGVRIDQVDALLAQKETS